jgi:hypothetical protein
MYKYNGLFSLFPPLYNGLYARPTTYNSYAADSKPLYGCLFLIPGDIPQKPAKANITSESDNSYV